MKQTYQNQKNSNAIVIAVKNPMGKIYRLSISVMILLLLSLLVLSCSNKKKETKVSASPTTDELSSKKSNEVIASTENYEIVPNEKVCMVNDKYMGIDQIPIDVNGITYYGCCANCVEKLQKNLENVRYGNNPIKDTKVDKASAVIVQDKSNRSVYYFDSKSDALTYISKNKK